MSIDYNKHKGRNKVVNEFDLERLRELIGREPTIYPKDINGFIEFLSDFAQRVGTNAPDVYRQIELAALPLDELQKLSPNESKAAIQVRQIARKAGFL